jgi:hypothetical protein
MEQCPSRTRTPFFEYAGQRTSRINPINRRRPLSVRRRFRVATDNIMDRVFVVLLPEQRQRSRLLLTTICKGMLSRGFGRVCDILASLLTLASCLDWINPPFSTKEAIPVIDYFFQGSFLHKDGTQGAQRRRAEFYFPSLSLPSPPCRRLALG